MRLHVAWLSVIPAADRLPAAMFFSAVYPMAPSTYSLLRHTQAIRLLPVGESIGGVCAFTLPIVSFLTGRLLTAVLQKSRLPAIAVTVPTSSG